MFGSVIGAPKAWAPVLLHAHVSHVSWWAHLRCWKSQTNHHVSRLIQFKQITWGCSIINHPAIGVPFMETSTSIPHPHPAGPRRVAAPRPPLRGVRLGVRRVLAAQQTHAPHAHLETRRGPGPPPIEQNRQWSIIIVQEYQMKWNEMKWNEIEWWSSHKHLAWLCSIYHKRYSYIRRSCWNQTYGCPIAMLDGHKAPVFHAPAHCPWIWVKAQDGAFSYGLVPKLHPNVDRSYLAMWIKPRLTPWTDKLWLISLPYGKRLHNYGKSTHF